MGPVILITGSSRGIGAAIARRAAEAGYDVAINYRSEEGAARAVLRDVEARGRRGILIRADVGVEEDVVRLFREVDEQLGPLDALVNNAGILRPRSRVADTDAERLEALFRVNVTGTFLCCREAVRRMSTRRGGRGGAIVNVSSVGAKVGGAGFFVDYAASKGAVDVLTRGLAGEVVAEGIRVNGVRPGLIETDIHDGFGVENWVERVAPTLPMGRAGTADEVAEAVLFLVSDAARYSTGTILDVTGGA